MIKTFSPEGTEPLLGVTGTMQQLRDGERVLVRMVVRPKERGYFSKYERDALAGSGGSNELQRSLERDEQRLQLDKKTSTPGNIGILALVACLGAALLLTGFRFTFPTATDFAPIGTSFTPAVTYEYGLGFVLAWIASVVVAEILLWKILRGVKPRRQFLDPKIIGERVDHQAMDFEIQIVAFVPDSDEWKKRARALSDRIADEYAGYGRPLGSAIVSHAGFEGVPDDAFRLMTQKRRPFPLSGRAASVIGTRELAGLWHLPATHVRPPNILRSASRHWPVMSSVISKGTPVGVTAVGRKRLVRLSADATRRHQFYVGASGEGKSTMMLHVLLHAMRQKANGENDGAVVVVDPHGDLAWDLLELVPPEIAHKVRFIDLSDRDRVVGINVLSPTFSSDRDATADLLVETVSRHWEFWGPNMASILSHSVKTLHEANTHPDVPPEEEYTLLDVRSSSGRRGLPQKRPGKDPRRESQEVLASGLPKYTAGLRAEHSTDHGTADGVLGLANRRRHGRTAVLDDQPQGVARSGRYHADLGEGVQRGRGRGAADKLLHTHDGRPHNRGAGRGRVRGATEGDGSRR